MWNRRRKICRWTNKRAWVRKLMHYGRAEIALVLQKSKVGRRTDAGWRTGGEFPEPAPQIKLLSFSCYGQARQGRDRVFWTSTASGYGKCEAIRWYGDRKVTDKVR